VAWPRVWLYESVQAPSEWRRARIVQMIPEGVATWSIGCVRHLARVGRPVVCRLPFSPPVARCGSTQLNVEDPSGIIWKGYRARRIRKALERLDYNKTAAAKALGLYFRATRQTIKSWHRHAFATQSTKLYRVIM